MNEKSCIYRFGFHLRLGLKSELFPLKSSKKQLRPALIMPQAHG